MEREITRGKYRHFKGGEYQVLDIAEHSETGESFVIYQALHGAKKIYICPYSMFASRVEKNKYPEVEQEYRFEKIG